MPPTIRYVVTRTALLGCLMVAGCGESPTAPGPRPSSVEGSWSGTVTDQLRGVGQLRFSARGFDATATGTFTLSFSESGHDLSGDVTVSSTDQPTIDLFFRARGAPGCPTGEGSVLHARTALDGNRMTGTYRDLLACGSIGGGSLEATRR
ncbi:MAG: hypothetical protein ABIT71_08205 [Vicinamibacteraceae bacterium]